MLPFHQEAAIAGMELSPLIQKWKTGRGLTILGASALALATLSWWAIRAHERSLMREVLNQSAPVISSPMELQFPARRADTPELRATLRAGVDAGFWIVRGGLAGNELEVFLTREGQKYFSVVGKSIVAAFRAGTRNVTAVTSIEETGTTRAVTFRYVWTSVQPATSVLGENTPTPGREYAGHAMLVHQGENWQLAHWSLPDFEDSLRQFH
jgi:hypothetical protein